MMMMSSARRSKNLEDRALNIEEVRLVSDLRIMTREGRSTTSDC